MVDVYNNLPQWIVDAQSVSAFQSNLTEQARDRCQTHNESWPSSFSCRDRQADDEDDLPVTARDHACLEAEPVL